MMLGHHGKLPTLPAPKRPAGPTHQTFRTDTESAKERHITAFPPLRAPGSDRSAEMTGAFLPGGTAHRPVQVTYLGMTPGFAGLLSVARNLRGSR